MSKAKLRTVQWEEMTLPEFAAAVKATGGVCVLTVGAMERHGTHLPLGNDALAIHEVAIRAARREAAIVFPPNYFGQTHETKNQPGSVALRHELILAMLDNLCDEIGRNGLQKIILLNGHGGNENILPCFVGMQLEAPAALSDLPGAPERLVHAAEGRRHLGEDEEDRCGLARRRDRDQHGAGIVSRARAVA